MSKHRLFLIGLCICTLILCADMAYAAPAINSGDPNNVLTRIEAITAPMTETLLGMARKLFIGLATLSLALGLGRMILHGESNVGAIASHFAGWMIYVGIFMWIMSSASNVTYIPMVIVNSFVGAGKQVGGVDVGPGDVLEHGIALFGEMCSRAWDLDWGVFLGTALIAVIMLVLLAMMAGALAVAMIEMHLVICGGSIMLGFAGFEYTRDIAFSYLKYAVAVGAKILLIMIVFSITKEMVMEWEASFKTANARNMMTVAGYVLGGSVCLYMTVRFVPSMAQSIITGTALSMGHEALTRSASDMAQAGRTSIRGLGEAGRTVKEIISNARRGQTAAFRGMANTMDAAKTGGIKSALGHIGAATPGVRGLMQASEGGKGNILRYVSASVLYGSHSDRATRFLTQKHKPEMSPGTPGGINSPEQVVERMRKG